MPSSAAAFPSNDFFQPLKARATAIETRYRSLHPISGARFEDAKAVMPGGYTRDSVIRKPFPHYFERASGIRITDVDDRTIQDFWFNATSQPVGHCHPAVMDAVSRQLALGTAFFGRTETETALARLLCDRLPSADRVRFANSGSEAVMMAVRFARAHTGRPLIIKFEGSYHGSFDDVSWSVGPAASKVGNARRPYAVPESLGLGSSTDRVIVLPYNDPEALLETLRTEGKRVAAVLVEPMANRIGLVMPDPAFVAAARAGCDETGAVLIFDEVIAFRLGYRGAQGVLGVTPDLTTLGKIIGGGFPVGAIAGRADIMDLSAADRPERVTHYGTFNANPVTMAAGFATMTLLTPEAFAQMNRIGDHIRQGLKTLFDGLPVSVTGAGSLFKINATDTPVRDYRSALTADKEWERLLSLDLLNEGFLLTSSLQGCVSTATTEDDADALLAAVRRVVFG